ncbi:DedA family protein [Arthrobacter alpinus]|uniref:DedA family protein n=1 Tax=Arthrobacter alpinus TaxID=656366 RepID=UPI0009F89C8E|nr:VTT domain-containing protein [Arthrobacter alpinus]
MDAIVSLPFVWAFLILFVIVMLRSNATYWAGRGLSAGGRKTKLQKHLDSPAFQRAEKIIARWGAPAVSVSFLTIGVQTAVNMAAGLGRMPLRRYIPATVVGSIAWACIYATIGLAAFDAALAAAAGSPWALIALVLVIIAVIVGVRRLRASRNRKFDQQAMAGSSAPGQDPVVKATPAR